MFNYRLNNGEKKKKEIIVNDFIDLKGWKAIGNKILKHKNMSGFKFVKNELSISPGSYVDISLSGISNKHKSFFIKNDTVIKRLGRITNFIEKDQNKPSASLVVKGSVFKLYFEQNVYLN